VSDDPRVVVLVTAGCHLCEDACGVVSAVCGETGIAWAARDLSESDPATQRQWREFVPVVLVDGDVHDVFRVSADRLRAAIG
jgi:predicted metal-dependent enzyme (double-stranded beta helix superfamily)